MVAPAGASAASSVIALCCLFSVLWIVCLVVPSGWHLSSVLFILDFETSLYQVRVTKNDIAEYSEDAVPNKFRILTGFVHDMTSGTFGLQEMQSKMCGSGASSYCDAWARLLFASWAMMFCGISIVVLYWLAAGFLAYFWNANPTSLGLKCSRVFLILIPTFAFCGSALYFSMTLDFGDTKTLSGTEKPVHYGPAFFLCICMVVFSGVPLFIFEMYVNSNGENHAYEARLKKYNMDDPSMQMQLGDIGPPPMYGAAPTQEHYGGCASVRCSVPPPPPHF